MDERDATPPEREPRDRRDQRDGSEEPDRRDDVGPHPDPEAVESVDADTPDERDGWTRDPEDVG